MRGYSCGYRDRFFIRYSDVVEAGIVADVSADSVVDPDVDTVIGC